MELSVDYLAVVANSTLRMMTPILLVTLAAAICTKVRIFNIAMEGTMLTGAFFSIVANHYTHNVFLSVLHCIPCSDYFIYGTDGHKCMFICFVDER